MPVSSLAGLVPPWAVSPRTQGSVCVTASSTAAGDVQGLNLDRLESPAIDFDCRAFAEVAGFDQVDVLSWNSFGGRATLPHPILKEKSGGHPPNPPSRGAPPPVLSPGGPEYAR